MTREGRRAPRGRPRGAVGWHADTAHPLRRVRGEAPRGQTAPGRRARVAGRDGRGSRATVTSPEMAMH